MRLPFKSLLLLILFSALAVGCSSKSKQSDGQPGNIDPTTKKEDSLEETVAEYHFKETIAIATKQYVCDTGKKVFKGKTQSEADAKMCAALQSDAENMNVSDEKDAPQMACALGKRQALFTQRCTGMTFKHVYAKGAAGKLLLPIKVPGETLTRKQKAILAIKKQLEKVVATKIKMNAKMNDLNKRRVVQTLLQEIRDCDFSINSTRCRDSKVQITETLLDYRLVEEKSALVYHAKGSMQNEVENIVFLFWIESFRPLKITKMQLRWLEKPIQPAQGQAGLKKSELIDVLKESKLVAELDIITNPANAVFIDRIRNVEDDNLRQLEHAIAGLEKTDDRKEKEEIYRAVADKTDMMAQATDRKAVTRIFTKLKNLKVLSDQTYDELKAKAGPLAPALQPAPAPGGAGKQAPAADKPATGDSKSDSKDDAKDGKEKSKGKGQGSDTPAPSLNDIMQIEE